MLSAAVAPRWALIAIGVPSFLWAYPWPWTRPLSVWLIAGLTYGWVSLAWAPDINVGGFALSHLLLVSAAVLLGSEAEDGRQIIVGLAYGVALTAPLVVLQRIGFDIPIEQAVPPAGLFLNRNVLVELAAPLMVFAFLSRMRWWWIGGLNVILVVAYDRAAILGFVVASLSLLPGRARIAAVAFGATILAVATWSSPWSLISLDARMTLLSVALDGLSLFGSGIGAFMALHPDWEYVHCDPLQLAFDLGIGAIPFFMVIGNALFGRSREKLAERAALLCLAVESMVSMPLQLPAGALLAGILVGRLYRTRMDLRPPRFILRGAVGEGAEWGFEDRRGTDP